MTCPRERTRPAIRHASASCCWLKLPLELSFAVAPQKSFGSLCGTDEVTGASQVSGSGVGFSPIDPTSHPMVGT